MMENKDLQGSGVEKSRFLRMPPIFPGPASGPHLFPWEIRDLLPFAIPEYISCFSGKLF
jgi:hypothetical protein